MYDDKYTFITNVDDSDTDKHKHNMREDWARLHAVFSVLVTITCHTHIGSSRLSWVCHPIFTPCQCAVVSELLDFSFYLSPHFLVFFLSFLSMYSDNFDSVTDNLRNSANGTFVTSDDTFPLTSNQRLS